jgi:hypothetical protein
MFLWPELVEGRSSFAKCYPSTGSGNACGEPRRINILHFFYNLILPQAARLTKREECGKRQCSGNERTHVLERTTTWLFPGTLSADEVPCVLTDDGSDVRLVPSPMGASTLVVGAIFSGETSSHVFERTPIGVSHPFFPVFTTQATGNGQTCKPSCTFVTAVTKVRGKFL